MANNLSSECLAVLKRLRENKNVLLSGAPGTGKSRLLGEVALAFSKGALQGVGSAPPTHVPGAAVPIPAKPPAADAELLAAIPAPTKSDRHVFRTVFHQNSKHRDFTTGMLPDPKRAAGSPDFFVTEGPLYKGCEHAKKVQGATLIVIDEINRGPAVQVFGGAIVAIEADKRLLLDGKAGPKTQFFDLQDPKTGRIIEYAIPEDVYLLAAMNQADASVEPLDVAFLRRWDPYVLEPSETVVRQHFDIAGAKAVAGDLPEVATVAALLEASVRAWMKVNDRISMGRSPEFRVGHGMIMFEVPKDATVAQVQQSVASCWSRIRAHVQEVFFGDLRGVAITLNAAEPPPGHVLRLEEKMFGDDLKYLLTGPAQISPKDIYPALKAIGK